MAHVGDIFLKLADALAERLIMLSDLRTTSSFDHQRAVGLGMAPQVGRVRTDYEMDLVTESPDAFAELMNRWPLESLGYSCPSVDLWRAPILENHLVGITIARQEWTMTVRGTCFKP